MKNMLMLLLGLLLFAVPADSQTTSKKKVGFLNGTIIGATEKEPLLNAAVQLFAMPDSVFKAGGASDLEGKFSISTEAPVVEEPSEPETPAPTVETTLPKIGKSIEFNSNGEYTYVAETAGNFNISQGGVATMMGGSYANVYVRINNGETITLEKNAARDFTLEAGDVVYITLEADAYSSFKVIWTAA